ncbi:MAG: thiol:disulfide interchange protein DsbA/DsbL [Gammaproteobacteria bacterium]|nr:thiol:disulfide interchange protein DsbA/DsbL [Gammaproteobacteria bacterium]MDD9897164.1 thiol:disulfide interchange protein DsbA/DsbL [Gammaproteobacteria bacterium]MDD9958093.1 thiol:disulfide interchange protein DsbA/DsbL [Gammaproteobacteria bacterium]
MTKNTVLKRALQAAVLLVLMPVALASYGQIERYVAGTHYVEIANPVNTNDASRVEVIEAFWYGCSHCFRFEPLITNWEENKPDDVDFVRFPAMWNNLMKIHAQVYYAAEALDAVDVLHEHIFNAINVERNMLQNESQIADLFAEHGVSEEDFDRTFNSFSVRTKVNQAERRMQDYGIRSTPNMIVNGKYLIATSENVRTQQEMLEVVDFLVEKERQAMRSSGD